MNINKPFFQLFTGRMTFLSPNEQCQSTEGNSFCTHLLQLFSAFEWEMSTAVTAFLKGMWACLHLHSSSRAIIMETSCSAVRQIWSYLI